jgi:hypothetical protein
MPILNFALNKLPIPPVSGPERVYVTDLETGFTYFGAVVSCKKVRSKIKVSLLDVQVFEYSSGQPLFTLPKINISRPADKIYTEESDRSYGQVLKLNLEAHGARRFIFNLLGLGNKAG